MFAPRNASVCAGVFLSRNLGILTMLLDPSVEAPSPPRGLSETASKASSPRASDERV